MSESSPPVFMIAGHGAEDDSPKIRVPDGCTLIVRANKGQITRANWITRPFRYDKLNDAMAHPEDAHNMAELIRALGSLAVYNAGDMCPNFKYIAFSKWADKDSFKPDAYEFTLSGIYRGPFTDYKQEWIWHNYCKAVDEADLPSLFEGSLYPTSAQVAAHIERAKRTIREDSKTLLTGPPDTLHLYMEYVKNHAGLFEISQKDIFRFMEKKEHGLEPGIFYNLVCRDVGTLTDYAFQKGNTFSRTGRSELRPEMRALFRTVPNIGNIVKADISEAVLHRRQHIKSAASIRNRTKSERRSEKDIQRVFYEKAVELFGHIKSVDELDVLADKYDKFLSHYMIFRNNVDDDGNTLVHAAVMSMDHEPAIIYTSAARRREFPKRNAVLNDVLRLLVTAAGTDVNQENDKGQTALDIAVNRDLPDTVKTLLQLGARKTEMSRRLARTRTPMTRKQMHGGTLDNRPGCGVDLCRVQRGGMCPCMMGRRQRGGSLGHCPTCNVVKVQLGGYSRGNLDAKRHLRGAGYQPTKRNMKYLRLYRAGKSIGFTMRSSLKAKGLIPRANGTLRVSPKYAARSTRKRHSRRNK